MSGVAIAVIAVLALIFLVLFAWAISTYNGFVQVRNNIEKAWANIDVLLVRRHDELSKLIEAVGGYLKHEAKLLNELTELRTGYRQAPDIDQKVLFENRIQKQVSTLGHVWEGYPDLKSSQNFINLQEGISVLESQIADRRELFNDSINIYNIQIESFPDLILAALLSYKRRPMLELPEEMKNDVSVRV